ncbi:MAG: FAD-binding protein [Coriobacteriales bacterium]|nr:FAD-binding protein [Coriobacteriales bacterium]
MEMSRRAFTGTMAAASALAAAGTALPALAAAPSEDNSDWLGEPPALTEADCVETVEAEIVVVGGALAGEFAAYSALLSGADVVVLERNGTGHVGGSGIGFVNSQYQLDAGQPWHDPYEVMERINNQTQNRTSLALLAPFCLHSGAVLDELETNVLAGTDCVGRANVTVENGMDEFCPSLNSHVDFDPTGSDSLESFNFVMHDWIKANGGRIFYNTCGRVLTQAEDGTVTGVIATNPEGAYVYYKASKAVIVCTGSYGHNEEMMEHFNPSWVCDFAKNYGIYNGRVTENTPITTDEDMDDGLGHKMMVWAGADMEQTDHSFQAWEDAGYYWWPFLQVTCKGERFRNEQSSWLSQCNTIVERPERVNYYWQIRSISDTDMPATLQIGIPLSLWDAIITSNTVCHDADTIEELAELMEVDPEVLKATVDRYNKMCEQGRDDDFGKNPKFLHPILEPPFRAARATCHFYCTSSGVRCNGKLQVCDKDWQPIPHLFAAGNNVGWRMGCGYQMTIPGLCNAFALFHGYTAGRFASNDDFSWDEVGA